MIAYENSYITGKYNPLYNPTYPGFDPVGKNKSLLITVDRFEGSNLLQARTARNGNGVGGNYAAFAVPSFCARRRVRNFWPSHVCRYP